MDGVERSPGEWKEELKWAEENNQAEYAGQIRQLLGMPDVEPPAPPPPPQEPTTALNVVGEFANAANRSALEGLDYVGPGLVNAVARKSNDWFGTEFGQVPTLTGAFEEYVPGAEGGFMPEGTSRDVVRGAGSALPVAAALTPAAGRNLGSVPGAAAEWFGLGTATPGANVAAQVDDITSSGRSAVEIADDAGYPITPGDRYESKGMKLLESAIDSTPIPFNPMHRIARQQQEVVNQAAAESLGLPGQTRLTQENMGQVGDNLSEEFKRLDLESDIAVTNDFQDALAAIEETAKSRLFKDPEITTVVDDILDMTGGENGRLAAIDYQNMTSQLKAKVRSSFNSQSPDPEFANSLKEIIRALDDLAENSMDGAALERLRKARQDWRTFTALEKSRAVKESGDVSGLLLANHLRRTDKSGYARGKNDSQLYDVARSSRAFPARPDSGTAGRMLLQHPLLTLGGSAAGGAGIAAYTDPKVLLALLGIPAVGSMAANAYMKGAPALIEGAQQIPYRPGVASSVGSAINGILED